MIVLVAAAGLAGAGAVAALAPLDVRLGLIGLTASLVGAALLSDPLPGPAVLAVRLSAAVLAVVVLRAGATVNAARRDAGGRGWSGHLAGSQVGWPAEALLGAAGAVAGLALAARLPNLGTGTAGVGAAGSGAAAGQPATFVPLDLLTAPSLDLAVAGLLLALALGPLLTEPAGLRRGVAAVLVTEAVLLVRAALAPAASELDEVIFGVLLAGTAAVAAALVAAEAAVSPAVAPAVVRGAGPAGRGTPAIDALGVARGRAAADQP